jgi:hypothetical protein
MNIVPERNIMVTFSSITVKQQFRECIILGANPVPFTLKKYIEDIQVFSINT